MSWYKTSQNNEDPEWEYPGSEHDYNPYWDYEADTNVDSSLVKLVNDYILFLKRELFPEIGFLEDIKASFVKLPGENLAMYIDGTEPYVVIAIDLQKIKKEVDEIGDIDFIKSHIKVTIVHELAHAIQDGVDLDYDEDEAEDFARRYVDLGDIRKFWE